MKLSSSCDILVLSWSLLSDASLVAPDELYTMYCTNKVSSDRVHRLLLTLSFFRPDRFMQLLSLIPILILLLYLLVSIDLVYTGLRELVPECLREQFKRMFKRMFT